MSNQIFIFDFDGTIADSLPVFLTIFNQLAEEFSYKAIQEDEIEVLKGKSSRELLRELNIPVYKLPSLIKKVKQRFSHFMAEINVTPKLKETLAELKRNKNTQIGIITSNSLENVNKFLLIHDLNCFDFVSSSSGLWGKRRCLKKIIEENVFDTSSVFYVGDETRDIEISKSVGVKVISVTWGYNSQEVLDQYDPDYIIQSPEELLLIQKSSHFNRKDVC